ncbi:hypothetical protein ACJX0J_009031, partial [Zea mays]
WRGEMTAEEDLCMGDSDLKLVYARDYALYTNTRTVEPVRPHEWRLVWLLLRVFKGGGFIIIIIIIIAVIETLAQDGGEA